MMITPISINDYADEKQSPQRRFSPISVINFQISGII